MKKSVVVTLTDEGMSSINKIAELLKSKGLTIGKIMARTGSISGSTLESNIASLKKISGVQAIDWDNHNFHQLPPSKSKVQ